MSVTHTWSIKELIQINDGTGTVCEVWYSIDSVDGDFNVDGGDRITLNTENIENFVSYENLTEEIVIGWVKQALGQNVDLIESTHVNYIEQMKNPPVPQVIPAPLPWTN